MLLDHLRAARRRGGSAAFDEFGRPGGADPRQPAQPRARGGARGHRCAHGPAEPARRAGTRSGGWSPRPSARSQPLAAALLDLDHFKKINDTFGHDHGDAVLAAAGRCAAGSSRESDFVGRGGGEEFLGMLPATDGTRRGLAEKVRAAVANIALARFGRAITGSFGVAVQPRARG